MTVPPKPHAPLTLKRLLIGEPLPTRALAHQTVNRVIGLAVFASDALSSTAYATEEILIILAMAGLSASVLGLSIPIAVAISVLLAIVAISYRQTIYAYPNGGGAYIVARDNLGELPAQIAGAALLTDYILTVAVSISAGVAQITSGLPELTPYRVEIAVGIILLMTIINLRGVRESGFIFSIPTYFFLTVMFVTLGIGVVRILTGSLPTVAGVEPMHHVAEPLTLFLVLRAFSSGCAAMTGVEAISNGITAFKEPRSRNAASTLVWMAVILIILFLGITLLAHQIEAVPSEVETVISQIGRTVHGQGSALYALTLGGTTLILLMAANTSYAGFPRLAALQAGDGFLPRQLTQRGNRLVFSWGIAALALLASAFVIVMGARTTALIPLYAIGVFLSFTISQTGMAVHMRKIGRLKPGERVQGLEAMLEYDPRWRVKMLISTFGAICTGIVMLVFAVTKFTAGAWFVVVLIPALVLLFFRIHYHYKDVAKALSLRQTRPDVHAYSVQTLILVDGVHAETVRVVNFAKSLGHPWKALHVAVNPQKAEKARADWGRYIGEGEFVVIPSPFRALTGPIREYVQNIMDEKPDTFVHVIMGHLVMDTFWEQALHQNSALIFNLALGDLDRVVVTMVPYQIHRNGGAKPNHAKDKAPEGVGMHAPAAEDAPDGSDQ
ncbi:MAG: APC family permease [Anaerolineae bacterium]|nr:APC family permease [Anaerolineae bacterium]